MPKTPYNLEESLGYVVGRAARALGARLNRNFASKGFDVTCEQWSILVNLGEKDGQTQQELAAHTCKDKTSMTRLIDGMEKHNLVVRIPDKQDKRHKLVYLTTKGKDFRAKLVGIVRDTLTEAQSGIKDQDMDQCKSILRKIYANVCDSNTKSLQVQPKKKA